VDEDAAVRGSGLAKWEFHATLDNRFGEAAASGDKGAACEVDTKRQQLPGMGTRATQSIWGGGRHWASIRIL
jgi:hypothetical protein